MGPVSSQAVLLQAEFRLSLPRFPQPRGGAVGVPTSQKHVHKALKGEHSSAWLAQTPQKRLEAGTQ